MDRIAALVEEALAAGLGSAMAVSIGDGGREVGRLVRGHVRRVPDRGPAIDEHALFDLASVTKPMATAALAMVLHGDGRLDLGAPVRRWLAGAQTTGTVGELLGHAAGCRAHVEFFRELRASPPADPRGALVAMASAEPCEPPGREAIYSDLGYIQLAAVLERVAGSALEDAFATLIGKPLGLSARFASTEVPDAVATELDVRGLVCGRVHDENAYYGGGACGHAGLFATIGDVATFAAAMVNAAHPLRPEVIARFTTTAAAPGTSWRLGWDTPSATPGVSHAGERWPRIGAIGHLGFTGTSLWLDLPRRRWVALLTNRVHPTREGGTAEATKALRRAIGDATIDLLE